MRNMRKILFIFSLIIIIAIWLLTEYVSAGTTYYMRADGMAANKAAATSCSSASTAMSVSAHNGETFSAGDVIVLCDDGGDYASTVVIPSSGSSGAGNTITYQAESGAEPAIDGANAIDNCILATDQQYLSITGINCENVNLAGFKMEFTTNKAGFTFDDVSTYNTGTDGISFNTDDAADTISDITITNSSLQKWSQIANSEGLIKFYNGKYDDFEISKNYINMVTAPTKIPGIHNIWDTIYLHDVTNGAIEYNYINGGYYGTNGASNHGIYFQGNVGGTGTCNGVIVRYNKVEYTGDDSIVPQFCTGTPLIYGNIVRNSGDDCFDNSSSMATGASGAAFYNNTCINPGGACLDSHASTVGTAKTTWKNNICYFDIAPTETNGHMFVFFDGGCTAGGGDCDVCTGSPQYAPLVANIDFSNNIYYSSTGTYGEAFRADDIDTGTTCNGMTNGTFEQWIADNSTPDVNSLKGYPSLSTSTGISEERGLQRDRGVNLCSVFTSVLAPDAVWAKGTIPHLIGICPVIQYDKWDIGATRMDRGLP
jgi:hypothetical protein